MSPPGPEQALWALTGQAQDPVSERIAVQAVRFDAAEMRLVRAAARSKGMTTSAFIREAAPASAGEPNP